MPKARRIPISNKRPATPTRRAKSGASRMEDARFLPLIRKGGPDSRWLILNAFVAETAEAAAQLLLGHVSKLRGAALRSWKQAYRRMFDIGVQAGGPGRAFEEVQLAAVTLGRIAAAGGQIQVTVYPAEPESPR